MDSKITQFWRDWCSKHHGDPDELKAKQEAAKAAREALQAEKDRQWRSSADTPKAKAFRKRWGLPQKS